MIRSVASEGARAAAMPARPLLVLALLAANVPAWAQQSPAASVPPSATVAAAAEPSTDGTAASVAPADASTMPPAGESPGPQDVMPSATPVDAHGDAIADTAPTPDAPSSVEDATPVADTPPPAQDAVPATDAPSQDATSADTPAQDTIATAPASTAAESDFDALYGAAGAADGEPAAPAAYDPWEPYNRRMHRFNNAVDRRVARPLATAYVKVVPRPIRSGVSNFFSNLGQPASAVNALLQGRPKQAAHSFGRFLINSTLGIGGIFDPATDAHLDNRNEDFGQTLGVWGWKRSRYVELPLFGPRTLRDVLGMAGDAPLSPMRQVQADRIRVPLQGLQLVDLRMQLMSTDAMREGAADDYALVRDAWMQRRAYQIGGDRGADDDVPDYLRDDPNMVPVDAMPVSGD